MDWLFRTIIDPTTKTSGYAKHKQAKDELIARGEMPATVEEHIANVQMNRSTMRDLNLKDVKEGHELLATDIQFDKLKAS